LGKRGRFEIASINNSDFYKAVKKKIRYQHQADNGFFIFDFVKN